jgi:antitoxin component YwqK of YwqJK toxin-antitoxin module
MKLFAEVKNGMLEGEFMTGHKNGQVASHGIHDEDFRVGTYEEFRENGTLSQVISYPLAKELFIIGIPYLKKTYLDADQKMTNQITYTKPCWEK